MAVPKKKTSHQKTRSRRAHDALSGVNISFDSKTGEPKLSHHMSLKDGFYNGRQVIAPSIKDDNAEEKQPD